VKRSENLLKKGIYLRDPLATPIKDQVESDLGEGALFGGSKRELGRSCLQASSFTGT